jgi:hypothetical protein
MFILQGDIRVIKTITVPSTLSFKVTDASSFISSVAWHHDTKILIITFSSGSIWAYDEVSKKTFNQFARAESAGYYFNKNIRNKYKGILIARKVDLPCTIYPNDIKESLNVSIPKE